MSVGLIAVRRPLLEVEHQALRGHEPDINRDLSELSIKWKKLGMTGLTLLEWNEYDDVLGKEQGRLQHKDPAGVTQEMNQTLSRLPTEGQRLTVKTYGVDFVGRGRFLSIAYLVQGIDGDEPFEERDRVTGVVDRMNGVTGQWGEFDPCVPIATIDKVQANDRVLDAFDQFRPETMTLLPAVADLSVIPNS